MNKPITKLYASPRVKVAFAVFVFVFVAVVRSLPLSLDVVRFVGARFGEGPRRRRGDGLLRWARE